ncbi:MAG: hypothetical protein WCE68_01760 [Anaerolineales bacterium]
MKTNKRMLILVLSVALALVAALGFSWGALAKGPSAGKPANICVDFTPNSADPCCPSFAQNPGFCCTTSARTGIFKPCKPPTKPSCPTTLTGDGPLTTCVATASGDMITITDVSMPGAGVPGAKNYGPAVDLATNNEFTSLCFPDGDTPPAGDVFMWDSAASAWVYVPTHTTTNPGMDCIYTYASGIYTVEY